jgi:hypothetical protein
VGQVAQDLGLGPGLSIGPQGSRPIARDSAEYHFANRPQRSKKMFSGRTWQPTEHNRVSLKFVLIGLGLACRQPPTHQILRIIRRVRGNVPVWSNLLKGKRLALGLDLDLIRSPAHGEFCQVKLLLEWCARGPRGAGKRETRLPRWWLVRCGISVGRPSPLQVAVANLRNRSDTRL